MKNFRIFLYVVWAFSFDLSMAQGGRGIPDVAIRDADGNTVKSDVFSNEGRPFVISFWATWCKPCVNELSAIADVYDDWAKETGVRIFIVSIDDARNAVKVNPFVHGQGWTYDSYLDVNSDFRRAMNVNTVPHTFLFDGGGHLTWEHTTYNPGDEEELLKRIKDLTAIKKP
jgi:thiol-disulfide isomerase/thioredoxin